MKSKKMPPNIILFFADQLRRDALGCYGNPICRTPNLDRIAREGVKFDNAFTTSPVCSPARASLLTGLYPHNHGVMINTHIAPAWSRGLSTELPTFSRILQNNGYILDYVGKWHVHEDKGPVEFGFTRHISLPYKNESVQSSEINISFPGGKQLICATSSLPKESHPCWELTNQGIAAIKERAGNNRPFFLRVDVNQPHFPNIVPEPYASMYDPSIIPAWPNFTESFKGKPVSQLRKHHEWHLEDKDWGWWSRVVSKYYGEVSLIDECAGRILNAIRECGIEENTIFLFSADHGDSLGSHKHFEKAGTMYDEIFRIPLIIKMPLGQNRIHKISHFVRLLDLMPTIVELAGLPPPDSIDAKSIVPLLRGETPADWPDSVYCEHHGEVWGYQSQRMIRTAKWKYVYNPNDIDELYDIEEDPWEMKNLEANHQHKDILDEMKARLIGWNDYTNDMFKWPWVRWNFPKPVHPLSNQ